MYRNRLDIWWTFKEVLDTRNSGDSTAWSMANTFYQEFYTKYANAPLWADSSTADDYIEDLYLLVYARYFDSYCVRTEYDYDVDEDSQVLDTTTLERFIVNFINLIVLTYPKYSTLLAYYDAQQSNLMNQISSTQTGVARFNDTPQNAESGDEFEGDTHVTNITNTSATSATDGMTPIERLKQIQDSYKSVMNDWSNEFAKLFIDENNISL